MKLKLLFAATMLTVATAFSASAMGTVTGDAGMAETTTEQRSMLAVSVEDTVNIKVTGVSQSLTLLSYKNGEEPSPENIQYIRQYSPDTEGEVNVKFKVRSIANSENGLYCVKLNDGADAVKTLYYKVGKPVFVKGTDENGVEVEYWQKVTFDREDNNPEVVAVNTTSIAYKANFKLNGGVVNEYGFTAAYGAGKEQYTSHDDIEFSGAGDFSFGVTIYGIPSEADISELKVVPYVNYAVNNTAVAE